MQNLLDGVVLDDDPKPVREAAACELIDAACAGFVPADGRYYHQVKRMLAAVGNRVEGFTAGGGGLVLPADLAPGEWRWLTADELELLRPSN